MNEDTCVSCGRYIPEGYGHVCTECLDKAMLRVNANVRLPKPEEKLTITLKYSGGQLTAETRNPLPSFLSRVIRWVKGGKVTSSHKSTDQGNSRKNTKKTGG